jgi:alpha-beta hydrolase superfamily lysophospholipase
MELEERAARDGTTLAVRRWPLDGAHVTVLIVHGLGEHSGRWAHVAEFFNGRGMDVTAFDLRGHGLSGGRPGYVERWSDYQNDIEDILVPLHEANAKIALYGHSLGGLIATSYVTSDRPQPDVLVASAPAFDDYLKPSLHLVAKVLGSLMPTLAMASGITGEQLSRDPEVGIAYFADPLVQTKTTLRLGTEAFAARTQTIHDLGRIHIPVLTIQGSDDRLVPVSASALLQPYAKRIIYEGLRHEVHNEPEQATVLGDVADWIESELQA